MEVKKGKFLHLDEVARKEYLRDLEGRIKKGFYDSDSVINKVVGKIASSFEEELLKYT